MSSPSLATRARSALVEASIFPALRAHETFRITRGAAHDVNVTLLVACSGGLDSQVLLDVLSHLTRNAPGLRLFAHGVEHGLRAGATAELRLAAELAAARGVPFSTTSLKLSAGGNLQARARTARLAALRAAAAEVGAQFVCTAHHLDDRAETVLIRVLRGAPLSGLAVLPVRSHDLLRPLIRAPKSDLMAHAARRKLSFADDPSNLDRKYLRARVRHDLIPLLRTLDPRIVEHLAQLADQAAELPSDPLVQALVGAAGASSTRAHQALREAIDVRNPHAEVLLRGGRTARWDRGHGFVIQASANPAMVDSVTPNVPDVGDGPCIETSPETDPQRRTPGRLRKMRA